jgi:hypothetical protein
MVLKMSMLPQLPEPLLPPILIGTPIFANPWNTTIPADSHEQHEREVSLPSEHFDYRRSHSI